MLDKGAFEKKDPLHTATIGTISNKIPQLRTIVLRKTVIPDRQLFFYTDIRSPKVQQLKTSSTLSWLFYDSSKNIQLRAVGTTTIQHQNDLTLAHWKKLPTYSRKTYGTQQAPSTPLPNASDNLPTIWQSEQLTLADTEYAYASFAVVVCEIYHLEWLHLQRSGNQRAKFDWIEEDWRGRWIVP